MSLLRPKATCSGTMLGHTVKPVCGGSTITKSISRHFYKEGVYSVILQKLIPAGLRSIFLLRGIHSEVLLKLADGHQGWPRMAVVISIETLALSLGYFSLA